jgi:hypothetical protein
MTNKNKDKLLSLKSEKVSLGRNEPKLIIYSKDKNEFSMELEKMIEKLASNKNLEIYRAILDLTLRLRMPLCESAIAILVISDEKDLKNMLSIQSLLINMRVVLILPDRNNGTVAAGHSLHPRYLSFKDNGLKDMKAVLARMVTVDKATYGQAEDEKEGLTV